MSEPAFKTITREEVVAWCRAGIFSSAPEVTVDRLTEILNGEYPLHEARVDVMSFRPEVAE